MRAYSQDLRRKVLEAVERGMMSKAQAAHLFGVSPSSAVKRYARMACRGSSLTPKKRSGRPPKIHEQAKKLLEEDVKERPAATVADRRLFLEHITGQDPQRLDRPAAPKAFRLRPKKRTMGAMERDEFSRAAWKVMVAEEVEAKQPVFVDEMGANTSLSPLYAWAPKGEGMLVGAS